MQAAIFSPLWFLCILLFKETFVQVQALKQKIPDPSLCQKEIWKSFILNQNTSGNV